MKKIYGLIILTTLIFTSCNSALDEKLNKEDFEQVKEEINSDGQFSAFKKQYLIDNISMQLGFAELGKAMKMDDSNIPTFREQINKLETDFDSIRNAKLRIRENNQKLENFVSLKDAKTASIDKYKGYLSMTLDFNNEFEKEILYIILNYKYVNKYDTEFFNEKSKLTDEIAGDFNGEIEISTKEEYNNVAEFIYTKVPVQASKALRDELGDDEANLKVEKDFLLEGLNVSTIGIVFKDKSELTYQDADWKYLQAAE